jgi:hypothetical protein
VRTVLLVPRRAHPDRDALWEWCRDRWQTYLPDIPIYEGHHDDDGPFNRSAAINTAARLADEAGRWDVGIVIDADIFLRVSQVRAAIKSAATGKVTWAHRRWRGFHEDHTKRVVTKAIDFGPEIDREDMDIYVERTNPRSWSCFIAIPREVWDQMGGFDERFVGWGYEDMAFKSLVTSLYPWGLVDGDVYHLWHPRSEERIEKGKPGITATREYVVNARLGRRYMVAAYRDHGWADEPGQKIPDELRARHVANLRKDDAKLAGQHRLPEWSDWWPTLAELQAGAKEHRAGPPPTVTIAMQTGGKPETWPERRAYLQASLASLTENVAGPICQRVVYDCWGDDAIRAELTDIAAARGFYIVGPTAKEMVSVSDEVRHAWSRHHFWRYLGKRAQGEFIFGVEDDFLYTRPVELEPMIDTLRDNPSLRQIALLRDAYYPRELAAGGIIAQHPERYTAVAANGHSRIEHRDHFTNNPALYRKSLASSTTVNPRPNSEVAFARALLADKTARFAYWGTGEPWIQHIGHTRAGSGY